MDTNPRPHRRDSPSPSRAIVAAIALLATATVLANRVLPAWTYPLCGILATARLLAVARWAGLHAANVGLDWRQLRRSVLVGVLGLALVAIVFGIALAIPDLRIAFEDGRSGAAAVSALLWLTLVRIPLGTVLLEEIAFRGVLPALFGGGRRWRWGPVLSASALFGLWHVLPSLALRNNGAVGTMFGGCRRTCCRRSQCWRRLPPGSPVLVATHRPRRIGLLTGSSGHQFRFLISWIVLAG